MAEQRLKTGRLYREAQFVRETINQEARTAELAFSSETPVDRWFGQEILDHGPKSVRLERLRAGGPLLVNHDASDQVGVVEDVRIERDRKGRAVVRFGNSPRAAEIFADVREGIRRNVSVGYWIHEMVLESEKNEQLTYRATDWEPLEISLVPVPADITVGVGRDHDPMVETRVITPDPAPTQQPQGGQAMEKEDKSVGGAAVLDLDKARAEARTQEQTRVRDILALGEQHHCPELARAALSEGTAVDVFRGQVLEHVYKAEKIASVDPKIGMSPKEKQRYSLVRALRLLMNGQSLDGLEKEASEATAKIAGRAARGFYIPQDVMEHAERVMQVADATKGGYLVGTEVLGGSLIELLRNKPLVAQLGARTLTGLVGNVAIPRVTGGATAYWLPETGTVTASDQAFGQLALTPKRLVGDTAYTKELLMQASLDVEGFVRNDLMTVLAIEKDRAAINGLGANGEPLGLLNVSGLGSVTFGAAATWAKVIDFETQVANANAEIGPMAYLTTPAVRGKWKGAVKVTNQASFLWDNGAQPGSGLVNGYRAEATKQVPSDKVLFGVWSDLIFAEWAGVDVVVDPYSLKKSGQIEITITLWCDLGIRHAGSFAVSTDSGAQ